MISMIEPMCRRRRTAEILASSAKSAGRPEELSSITDDLLARAHVAVRQSDDLISALEAAGRRAMALLQDDAGRDGERSEASGEDDQRAGTVSAGARLLATRMAIECSSRGTIASRLHREFGIEDPTAILREADL